MQPTLAGLVELIEARRLYFNNGRDKMKAYAGLDYDAHKRLWDLWKARTDVAWLPELIALARALPIAEDAEELHRKGWELDLAEVFGALARTDPSAVVNALVEAIDADGEPAAVVMALYEVALTLRSILLVPGQQTRDDVALLSQILNRLWPLAGLIDRKSDDYLTGLIDTIGEGVGALHLSAFYIEGVSDRARQLLRLIAANTPSSRTAVHRETNLFLNPRSG